MKSTNQPIRKTINKRYIILARAWFRTMMFQLMAICTLIIFILKNPVSTLTYVLHYWTYLHVSIMNTSVEKKAKKEVWKRSRSSKTSKWQLEKWHCSSRWKKKTSNLYCNMQSQHCQQQYIAVHQTSSLASGR